MTSMSELLLLTSPGDGPRHEDTSVRACARRAARAELRLRRRVTECIPLRLRAGICGTVEIREWGAQPPGGWPRGYPAQHTRVCCHWGLGRWGRRYHRAQAAGRLGAPTFQPAARAVLEPAALLPLRPLRQRARRRAAEGHPERRAMRRRRRVRARRAARQHLRTCRMRGPRPRGGAEEVDVKGVCVLRGRGYPI